MNKNKRGFTLIELLAVIVILGLLMAIAIPSVTKYITQSRKKTVTTTIGNYIGALTNQVNDMEYVFTGSNTVYAVPIECIALERGGTDPFGKWHQANNAYWAYVLVQYDDATSSYTYGFTFKDSAGYGLYPITSEKLKENGSQIQTGLNLKRPTNGTIANITAKDNWTGFDLDDDTALVVLESTSEGEIGNGTTTCTLCQKGDNYAEVISDSIKTLRISDETYQFKKGMTWRQWVESDYNTGDYYISNDGTQIFVYRANKGSLTHTFIAEYDCIVTTTSVEEELKDTYYTYGVVRVDDPIMEEIKYKHREGGYSTEIYDSVDGYWEDHYVKREANGSLTYIKIK